MGDGIVEVKQDTHELRSICDSLAARGVEARFSEMLGPTVDMILEEAERFDADLIVIGTHEHGQFYHLVFGGVRETLIARSPCPVLVVPAPSASKKKQTSEEKGGKNHAGRKTTEVSG